MKNINKVLIVITFVTMIVVNTLANALPINGITTGMASDAHPNLFAPAGITFAIWGVIYLFLALFTFYQLGIINKNDEISNELLNEVGTLFIISSVANTAWIFAWHYQVLWLSVILIIAMLLPLIMIANALRKEKLSVKEKFFVKVPFSLYFGWLTVATIANITTFLVSLNWNGFGIPESMWTTIIIFVGAIIGIITLLKHKDYIYGLVLIWAYSGILLKHVTIFNSMYISVIVAAIISIALILAASIYSFTKKEY